MHWLMAIKWYLYTKMLKWEVNRIEKELVAIEVKRMHDDIDWRRG